MEEQSNQVVPSTSYDWLDRFDDEGSNNQVVPATIPRSSITGTLHMQACEEPRPQPVTLPGEGNCLLNPSAVLTIEDSFKELTLEGMQVVPSASGGTNMDSLNMDVELQTLPKKKLIRSAPKNSASKA